ncbi:uncharacterized protein BO80DRAFT_426986 [Aspergillus ibericus CBS 121593]|uniref:DUF8035 domain-containing protein n=1 Tax=Aspergillus ibericus CBS 121593 TaxID=1448316 RepID=A0A395GXV2_9EURO|nr:hypothetical protein BO80DRAFT_426986 [Aspergillus ibericus CBS 121593]RAK98883.1 hypothetical protein BO80DRAFT_426986 [Aspergillus ibericus CBS 121593]
MPRRGRAREYDEENLYEAEREVYPRRGRDERFFEEDIRYKRRGPEVPPSEKLERLHLQAQRGPEILREAPEYPRELAPPIARREPENLEPLPRERLRVYDRDRDELPSRRGRPRSRGVDVEEEVVIREETDRRYTDSDSDRDIVVVPKKERPVYRRRYEIPKEPKPRSRSLLEEKIVRESDYDPEGLLLPEDVAKAHHSRHRSGPLYEKSSRSRHKHRSHRHRSIDEADDELDEEVDEEKILIREARKRGPTRSVDEETIFFDSRERSSSPEVVMPRAPSPVQIPPVRERHVHESRRKVYPPRAPSPEIVLTEAEIRQRERGPMGRSDKEDILIVRREDEEVLPPSRRPSADPYRREQPVPIDPPKPRSLEREKEKLTIIRRDGSRESLVEEEFVEEDFYRRRGHGLPPRKEVKTREEDLKIVTAPPRDKSSTRAEIVTQEIKPSRYTDRESTLVINDVKESDEIPERQLGRIGRRYVGIKDRRESLWTEITKDLVVKEALERSGYEYEETGSYYYVFSYLEQEDVDALIELSEEIRRARRRRIQEIHRERATMPLGPPPLIPAADKTSPLLLDHPTGPPRFVRDERRKKEREFVEHRWRPPRSERW